MLELQSEGHDVLSERGEVVLVRLADFLDKAVSAEALHQAGDLAGVPVLQPPPKIFVLKATDVELTAAERLEERLIVGIEKVEAAIGTLVLLDWFADLVQFVSPSPVVLNDGNKFR